MTKEEMLDRLSALQAKVEAEMNVIRSEWKDDSKQSKHTKHMKRVWDHLEDAESAVSNAWSELDMGPDSF